MKRQQMSASAIRRLAVHMASAQPGDPLPRNARGFAFWCALWAAIVFFLLWLWSTNYGA